MYKFRVVEQHKFLTGHMAGMTIKSEFPICSLSDYNVEKEVGKVWRSLFSSTMGRFDKYEVVSARIVKL
jgi:hypothetical protein